MAATEFAWREFIATQPPPRLAAAAQFALGIVLSHEGRWPAADDAFTQVRETYPDVLAESGLPLQPLSDIQLLQCPIQLGGAETNAPVEILSAIAAQSVHSSTGAFTAAAADTRIREATTRSATPATALPQLDIDTLCADAIRKPTVLTSKILALAEQWQRRAGDPATATNAEALWERHEIARRLSRSIDASASGKLRAFQVAWTSLEEPWLVVALPDSQSSRSNLCLVCRSESATQRWLRGVLRDAEPIPKYFGVTVELGGRQVWSSTNAASSSTHATASFSTQPGSSPSSPQFVGPSSTLNPASAILASDQRAVGDTVALKVNVHLAQPQLLFARQQSRSRWFGMLILTAALTALAGLCAAWRAFHRQLRLSRLKSDFVSSVSHELRSPIASVRLMAERLERGRVQTDEKKSEYFRFIRQECQRLSSLIENVLDFSRIEQGRKQYEWEPVDAIELVRQTVQVMEPSAAERQVQLVTQLPEASNGNLNLSPSWDGRAVQQALLNLIDNALKHSPSGERVTVGLDLAIEASDRDRKPRGGARPGCLHLWVEDHGPGIPATEHERIFERFYRLGSELRRETQGVGIGLSIVKHVVDAHGGRVIVRSAVGEGARFTLALPVNPPNTDP